MIIFQITIKLSIIVLNDFITTTWQCCSLTVTRLIPVFNVNLDDTCELKFDLLQARLQKALEVVNREIRALMDSQDIDIESFTEKVSTAYKLPVNTCILLLLEYVQFVVFNFV